jgi:hypothetical protein
MLCPILRMDSSVIVGVGLVKVIIAIVGYFVVRNFEKVSSNNRKGGI